jgi:hypothetical protein
MNQALCQLSYLGRAPGGHVARSQVGNHGIGPCCYRYIRAASSPAESPPVEGERAGLPGFPHGRSRPAPAPTAHLHGRVTMIAGRPSRPPASSRAPCLSANLPAAEGGLFESRASRRASASNGARHACPVHPPSCCSRDSDPEPLRSGRSASASWARAAWSGWRAMTPRPPPRRGGALPVELHPPKSPRPESDRVPSSAPRKCSATELRGHGLPSEPSSGADPDLLPYRGRQGHGKVVT